MKEVNARPGRAIQLLRGLYFCHDYFHRRLYGKERGCYRHKAEVGAEMDENSAPAVISGRYSAAYVRPER